MRLFIFLVLGFFTLATQAEDSCRAQTLALATQKARAGKLDDKTISQSLVKELEACFSSANPEIKTTAAYLMTYALRDNLIVRNPYLDQIEADPNAEKTLGAQAMIRFYRLRADQGYENAKFDQALKNYQALYLNSKGDLKAYAALKLGWTYINKNQQDEAYKFWWQYVAEAQYTQQPISPNIFHGIAQAYVESKTLPVEPTDKLCVFAKSSPDYAEAIQKGIGDGISGMTKREEFAKLGEKISACDVHAQWYEQVGKKLEGSSGQRKCDAWAMLSKANKPMDYGKAPSLFENCYTAIASRKGALPILPITSVALWNLSKDERQKSFGIYRAYQAHPEACRTGMIWISEVQGTFSDPKAKAIAINPKDIVESCKVSMNEGKIPAEELIATLHAWYQPALGSSAWIQKPQDPRNYVVQAFSEHPGFYQAFSAHVLNNTVTYEKTTIPTMLAEKASGQSSGKTGNLVANLYERFRQSQKKVQSSVWENLFIDKVQNAMEEGRISDALSALEVDAPLANLDINSNLMPLWIQVLWKADGWQTRSAAEKNLAHLVTKYQKVRTPEKLVPLIELLAKYDRWKEVSELLAQVDAKKPVRFSEGFYGKLVDAYFNKKVTSNIKTSIPEVNYLLKATAALKDSVEEPASLKNKNLPKVFQDLELLKNLKKEKVKAEKASSDATIVVSRWVDFLSRSQKVLKHAWQHSFFAEKSTETIREFCEQSEKASHNLKQPAGLSEAEWNEVIVAVRNKLNVCLKTAGVKAK